MTNLYTDGTPPMTVSAASTRTEPSGIPTVNPPAARAAWSAAFVQATNALLNPGKSATAKVPTKSGGSYSYSYAPLPDIIDLVKPVLAEYGLTVVQDVASIERGVGVTTCVWHRDGHVERFGPVVLSSAGDAQAVGSAITYLRRYGLCAALGIAADEDDDGQKASGGGGASRAVGQTAAATPPSVDRDAEGAASPPDAQAPSASSKHSHRPNYDAQPNAAGRLPCAEPGCRAWVVLKEEAAS